MTEYIERDAALNFRLTVELRPNELTATQTVADAIMAYIKAIPAADVVPVRHGRWEVTNAYPHNVHCSVCYKRFAQTHWDVWEDGSLPRSYCPNCGAKMDGERRTG